MSGLVIKTVAVVFLFTAVVQFGYWMITVPEMAWSQSKDKCVLVTNYKGERIANGCQKVAEGKLKPVVYTVP